MIDFVIIGWVSSLVAYQRRGFVRRLVMAACNCQLQKFVANGNPRRGGARTATFASELCASLQRAQPDAVFCSRATLTGRLRPQLLRHCLDVCSSPLCSSDVRSSFGKAGLGTGGTGDSVTQFYPVSFPSQCSTIKVVRRTDNRQQSAIEETTPSLLACGRG